MALRHLIVAGALLAESVAPVAAADAGVRVASATVCADQYVLALARPEQIAGLSPDAANPWLSLLADQAADYPRLRSAAEVYLDAEVDVVVTNGWSDHQTAALLERFGVHVVRIPLVDDFTAVAEATRTVAAALGQPERGEALVADMRRRLEVLARQAPGRGRSALYLRPDGGTAAAGTFVDAVLTGVGLRNHATAEGLGGWTSYGLERFIASRPDVLVTSFFGAPYPSSGGGFGNHPAFRTRAAALPRVEVPGALWVCGGWILAEAAEHLARELPQ